MELSSQVWNYRPQVSGVLITPTPVLCTVPSRVKLHWAVSPLRCWKVPAA